MKYADLKGIIEFIYNGEVSIDQGALTSFLIAAESLKIKGNYSVFTDAQAFYFEGGKMSGFKG